MSAGPTSARSVVRNAVYGFSTWLIPLGLSFVATPIIVKSLGHNVYGIYALVLGFVGYSFNLNTGRAVTKFVAEYRAAGESGRIREVVSTTLAVNLFVGSLGGVSIALAAEWLVKAVFRIAPELQADAVTGFRLAAAIIFLTMQWQVFLAVLQGYQRFDLYSRLTNACSVLTIGGSAGLALAGFGVNSLLAWSAALLVLFWAGTFLVARRLLPEGGPALAGGTLRRIAAFSGGVIGYQLISNAVLLFERGWIIRKLGEESLTFYVVPMTLAIYIHGFVSSLLLVIFPLSSELAGERERLTRMYLAATKIVCFFIGFIALTLIVESRLFLTLWMGADLAEASAPVLVVHTLTFSLAALLVVSWNMTEGLGYPSYNFGVYTFCFAVAIAGMVLFTESHGILGAAASRLAGFGVLTLSVPIVERWLLGRVQIGFWARTIASIGVACGGAYLAEMALGRLFEPGWIGFIVPVGTAGVVYCAVLAAVGFISDEEKKVFKRLLRRD